uniref:Zn-finger (U1-like)-11 n=1 Tax=Phallusia mammillata TaxID=59560 RepID=A0A6F9DA80_9ASCI|nr:Zn-finger (U1-like)-11 [Phallusia mammillata]
MMTCLPNLFAVALCSMDGYYGRFSHPKHPRQPLLKVRGLRPRWPSPHAIRNPHFSARPQLRHPPQHIRPQITHNNKVNLKITVPDLQRSKKGPGDVFKRLGRPVNDSPAESLHEKNEMKSAYLLHKEKLKTKHEQNTSVGVVKDEEQLSSPNNATNTITSKEKWSDVLKSVPENIAPKSNSGETLNDLSLLAHYLLHRRTLKSKQDIPATSDGGTEEVASETKLGNQANSSVIDMDISEVNSSKDNEPAPQETQEIHTPLEEPEIEKTENPTAARHVEKDTSEESRHLLITTHFEKKSDAETANREIPPENRSTNPDISWYCVVCNMDVNAEKITHYREEIHKKNKKLARPHCDVCDQWFNRPRQLVQHVKSQEHKDKVKEARDNDDIGVKTEHEEACANDLNTDRKPIQQERALFENAMEILDSPFVPFPDPPELPDLEPFSLKARDSSVSPKNRTTLINAELTPPTKNSDIIEDAVSAKDMPHIIPVAGFYCEVCCDFFFDETSTLSHCKLQSHQEKVGKANGETENKSGSVSGNSNVAGTKTKRRRKSVTTMRPLAHEKKLKSSPPGDAAKPSLKSDLGVPRKTITTEKTIQKPQRQLTTAKQSPRKLQPSNNETVRSGNDAESAKPFDWKFVIPKRNRVT